MSVLDICAKGICHHSPLAIGAARRLGVDHVEAGLTGEVLEILYPESPRKSMSRKGELVAPENSTIQPGHQVKNPRAITAPSEARQRGAGARENTRDGLAKVRRVRSALAGNAPKSSCPGRLRTDWLNLSSMQEDRIQGVRIASRARYRRGVRATGVRQGPIHA